MQDFSPCTSQAAAQHGLWLQSGLDQKCSERGNLKGPIVLAAGTAVVTLSLY